MSQQTRRMVVAALVIVVLLGLVAILGVGSKPNAVAGKAESSAVNTLVGGLLVIVGGVLSLAGNYWIETQRWRREDRTRFRSDLYQRCVDLYVVSVLWQGGIQEHRPDFERWALFDEMVTALSHIRMTAGEELADAATLLVQQFVELAPADDPEEDESYEALEDLREAFNQAARKELRVPFDPEAVRRIVEARRQAGSERDG